MDEHEKKIYEQACKLSDEESSDVAHFFGKGFIRGFTQGVRYALRVLGGKQSD